jgi:arylsulfatase A-like enzyme
LDKPNVIFLIVDALRAHNVSCYGYERPTTPHLDRFAAHNLRFQRAFTTATWTIPSHASLLTGLYLSQHRIENVNANRRLHPAIVTLPQALQQSGYRTTLFTQNPLFSPEHNFDQFGRWYGFGRHFDKRADAASAARWQRLYGKVDRYRRKLSNSRQLFGAMLRHIQANEGQPFLMMANVTDVHYPWAVPPLALLRELGGDVRHLANGEMYDPNPFQFNSRLRPITEQHRTIWRILYDSSIRHIDHEIGRFLEQLKRWQGYDNTIVIITADHGEMLGDGRDIFGHTLTLHDHVMHVPLLLRHPDYGQGTVEGVVQTLDLFPSLLEWCQADVTGIEAAQRQRPPLSQAIAAPGAEQGTAFAEEDYTQSYDVRGSLLRMNRELEPERYPQQQIAVRSAWHKLLWRSDGRHELYDLNADAAEAHNRIEDQALASVRCELQERLEQWRAALAIFPPVVLDRDITTSPEVSRRLQELGYLG